MKRFITSLLLVLSFLLPSAALAETTKSVEENVEIAISVNINTADVDELSALLIGIGEQKAKAIVEFREQNGEFMTADDLSKVKGIGAATVEKNRDRIEL